MSTAQTVGESKVWVGKVLYMVPDPVADEISRLSCEGNDLRQQLDTALNKRDAFATKLVSQSCEGKRYCEALTQIVANERGWSGHTPAHILAKEALDPVSEGHAPEQRE